jgi:light-regulated signal transduction histidine kinase (bacteriophytochrome)
MNLEKHFLFIESLPISEEEKSELRLFANYSLKQSQRIDFQLNRTLKDKSIVINLLNKTIEDLRDQQDMLRYVNEELSKQKKEIETKNLELQQQKVVVEEQSKRLEESYRELEMSFNELEQFSYIASHDLKSPLRTIASYAQLLKRRYSGKIDEDADEFIAYIVSGVSHMNNIIKDLLEFSNAAKEKEFAPTDLNDILCQVKFNLKEEIEESGAIISFEPLPIIYVHQSGMLQLFQNLIANSIKFRAESPPKIQIEYLKMGESWVFKVKDNGLGLEEAFQEKAFMPFQRINHLDRPGTGMGLAICKKIVKIHKGEIWYESKLNQGTTFTFTLRPEEISP